MQSAIINVKGLTVKVAVVERGERAAAVRAEAFDADAGRLNSTYKGDDWDDEADYASSYPATYAAMRAAGLSITNAVAVIEQVQ